MQRWRLWLLAAVALVFLAALTWIALEVHVNSFLVSWDRHVTNTVAGARTPGWDRVFWCFTLLGNTPVMAALASSAVLMLAVWGRLAHAILVGLTLLTAEGVSNLTKALVHRARPPQTVALLHTPGSYSLPSGHAAMTLVFLGLLVFLALREIGGGTPRSMTSAAQLPAGAARSRTAARLRTAARMTSAGIVLLAGTATVAFVGLSRIFLGVHWASDVLAGWSLGGGWLALALAVYLKWGRRGLALRFRSPMLGRRPRLVLVILVVLVAVAMVVFTARADSLLAAGLR